MHSLRYRIRHFSTRLSMSWYEIPSGVRRILLFVAVAGLTPWLTITSFDIANYVVGAEQILTGNSVYDPQIPSLVDNRFVPSYPYLPSFAMILAVGIAPFFVLYEVGLLPGGIYEVIARQITNGTGYVALLGVPLVAHYAMSVSTLHSRTERDVDIDWMFWGILILALAPPLWFQVVESGSDTLVALLVLLGVYAVMRDRWLLAGVFVGTATFKFTALPLAAVLALYALQQGRKQFVSVALGGLGSQLPNLLYFAVFVEDFLFVLERRGAMSLYSGETRSIVTAPFRAMGLEQWYIDVGFFISLLIFITLGAVVARRRDNLVLGFAVAYLATSYFAPVGEINASVLVVLLLFEAAVNFHRRQVRYLAAGLLTVEIYGFIFHFRLIDYVSVLPFPWRATVLQGLEFGAISITLVGLIYFSDHKRLQPR